MTSLTLPNVSIGMPVYNGEKFIREALNSLLGQTFTDFELIISDNASTDDTAAICRDYASRDIRILYVRQSENLGAMPNFQFVLDEAVGQYFMWASADDIWESTCLEELTSILDNNQQIALVASDVINVNESGLTISTSRLDNIRLEDVNNSWDKIRPLFFENPTTQIFFAIYGLFRTQLLRQASLNYHGRAKYLSGSEIPFLAQIALMGKITSIPTVLKLYRRHDESSYHIEQENMSFGARLEIFITISNSLVEIILRSELSLIGKLKLMRVVIVKEVFFLSKMILKKALGFQL